jgi:hypothetical protein
MVADRPPADGERLLGQLAAATRYARRSRLLGWLVLFFAGTRMDLPPVYAAALAALPWVLLPPDRGKGKI